MPARGKAVEKTYLIELSSSQHLDSEHVPPLFGALSLDVPDKLSRARSVSKA